MSVLDRSATEIYGLVKQASQSEQRLDIVQQHLDNPVVVQLLDLPQFFQWFDLGDKTQLLENVLMRYPMPSATWLTGAMHSGIDSELLSTLVINQLRHMDASLLANFVETFVRDGAGQVSRNTMWATEEDYERDYPLSQSGSNYSPWLAVGAHLKEILDRCVLNWPKAFFLESTDKVLNPDGAMTPYERMNSLRPEPNGPSRFNRPEPFLLQGEASGVLEQAAKELTSLEGLSMTALSQLDRWTRNHVAYKCLEGSLPFLVMAALKDGDVWFEFEDLLYSCLPKDRKADRYKALEQIKQIDSVLVRFGHYGSLNAPAEIISYVAKAMNGFGLLLAVLVPEKRGYGRQVVAHTYRGTGWRRVRYVRATPASADNPRVFILRQNDRTSHNALVVIDLKAQNIPDNKSPIFFTPDYVMETQSRPHL